MDKFLEKYNNAETMRNRKSELHFVIKEIESLNRNPLTKKTAGIESFTSIFYQIFKEGVH